MCMVESTSTRSTPSDDSHHGIEIEHDMEIEEFPILKERKLAIMVRQSPEVLIIVQIM